MADYWHTQRLYVVQRNEETINENLTAISRYIRKYAQTVIDTPRSGTPWTTDDLEDRVLLCLPSDRHQSSSTPGNAKKSVHV